MSWGSTRHATSHHQSAMYRARDQEQCTVVPRAVEQQCAVQRPKPAGASPGVGGIAGQIEHGLVLR